jgi:hypothetical protein
VDVAGGGEMVKAGSRDDDAVDVAGGGEMVKAGGRDDVLVDVASLVEALTSSS